MASQARDVLTELVAAVQEIDGRGLYTYNLRDEADRVQIGAHWPPDYADGQVFVTDVQIRSDHEAATGWYRRTMSITIEGYVGANGDTPGIRALAALDLLNDVARALEGKRSAILGPLGGNALDLIVRQTTVVDGFEGSTVAMGGFGAVVEVYWLTSTGI